MCIFVHEVKVVRNTRILVGPTSKGRQVTVYENYVEVRGGYETAGSRHGPRDEIKGAAEKRVELARLERKKLENANAMILPCPLNGGEVVLLDLSKDGFRFEHYDECFPTPVYRAKTASKGKSSKSEEYADEEEEALEVQEVGAYNVSVAKTFKDLKRVDRSVFSMPTNVEAILSRRYSEGYAFVICAFDGGKKLEPHPIGYVHDRLPNGHLFVPCVHEHGHDSKDGKEHFDHSIYSFSTARQTMGGSTPEDRKEELYAEKAKNAYMDIKEAKSTPGNVLARSKVLHPLLQSSLVSLRKLRLKGRFDNEDISLSLHQRYEDTSSSPAAPTRVQEEDPYDVKRNLPNVEEMSRNLEEWQTLYKVLGERLKLVDALSIDGK